MQQYWVRVGLMGHVGRFRALDGRGQERGADVVCRTSRGLEVGEVLSAVERPGEHWDGDLIRLMTPEDRLLWQRLRQHQVAAYQACSERLQSLAAGAGSPTGLATAPPPVLMDVEPLFDGKSLYFYFLGEPSPEVAAYTAELAETYDAVAQLRKFGEVLTAGCGPDCGQGDAGQCGTSCSNCSVACALEAARR